MTGRHAKFLEDCVALDLEVNPKTAKIFAMAAIEKRTNKRVVVGNGKLDYFLEKLEKMMLPASFLIGHNLLKFDLEHLIANRPRMAKFSSQAIDTLWLNPLAFPRNPYHHLVKHYQDGRLSAGHKQDPELDALLVFEVLGNQLEALSKFSETTLTAYHYLTTRLEIFSGFDAVFKHLRNSEMPSIGDAQEAVRKILSDQACIVSTEECISEFADPDKGWPLAYTLSWISVSGGNSVMAPWVVKQFPAAMKLVRRLRTARCHNTDCTWCRNNNDPRSALRRWFPHDDFKPLPRDEDGNSLQRRIVEDAMRGKSLLGILPTGTGKSICYQIPALSNYDKTGSLTVVISPLVALMGDQIDGMRKEGIASAVTVNGNLSMPERTDALSKVSLGDASMLLISPEQLRSNSVRSALFQREVDLWVLDEAHCVSKWGHDFRPDYRFVGRFIKESFGTESPVQIICLTATAKPEVTRDIQEHFKDRLKIDLQLIDGGAVRTNLRFEVRTTMPKTKPIDIRNAIDEVLPKKGKSGAIVYCSSRKRTEEIAQFLQNEGFSAEHFHAKRSPEEKKEIQEKFRVGKLRVIVATNAFGMGIDKSDVRLVVHADIPGSLENYLQEAGRAGRDGEVAQCVLFFYSNDIENQFSLVARSRLKHQEIGAILKAIRRLEKKATDEGKIIATSGEIVREEHEREFARESNTDDTRVKTALYWLEEATLLTRDENRVSIFPSSLKVTNLDEAKTKIDQAKNIVTIARRKELIQIVSYLMRAPVDQGISTDDLTRLCGLSGSKLNKALADLEALGIVQNDLAVTIFVHKGVSDGSLDRLKACSEIEKDLIAFMREQAPDAEASGSLPFKLTEVTQALKDEGHEGIRPDIVEKLIQSIASDGRDQDGGKGSIWKRKVNRNTIMISLKRSWDNLEWLASLRREGAGILLNYLLEKIATGEAGKDIQVETTLGEMLAKLNDDLLFAKKVKDMTKLKERSLLWMHEQEVVVLGKGLTIFRPALTIKLRPGNTGFTEEDFKPLNDHYREQTIQIHIMGTYAEIGLENIDKAQCLANDYFELERGKFLNRWLPDKDEEILLQTTEKSRNKIVTELNNPTQQKIVSDKRIQTSVLVLAGPGSGKTKVLVHRIAFLVRVMREDPNSILVLAYNRHAASEIKARLRNLIGDDAIGVTIQTCHAFAMSVLGITFSNIENEERDFKQVLKDAVDLITGKGIEPPEAEAQRESLIHGYRWMLVDEYQDIGAEEYSLIAAVAGRSIQDKDLKLSLFAVGDDDQNIYSFKGASVQFIRQFEKDYKAKPSYLIENFRSTSNIINAANAVIQSSRHRMKADHAIVIDRKRANEPMGGLLEKKDPLSYGKVQVLKCADGHTAQSIVAVDELLRLSKLEKDWNWNKCAVIARKWEQLEVVRAYAEDRGIPVSLASEKSFNFYRLRETQDLVDQIKRPTSNLIKANDLHKFLQHLPNNRWTELIEQGIETLIDEIGERAVTTKGTIEWIAEWSRTAISSQRGLLLLVAHSAKGLEFDHVAILDGDWYGNSSDDDPDAARRLYYVAMTRARESLTMIARKYHPFLSEEQKSVLFRTPSPSIEDFTRVEKKYFMPNMNTVYLDYVGTLGHTNPSLNAIKTAKVGDSINLKHNGNKWEILNTQGHVLGHMAERFEPPDGYDFMSGEIGAITKRLKTDIRSTSKSKDKAPIRRNAWEVVLPELIYKRRVAQELR